jgi:non-ribosomal peptide synthase protein (TIGR01720 family)
VVAHHLGVDGVSWRILLEDLEQAYEQARLGRAAQLPAKTTSFKQWAERLQAQARSEEVKAQAAYWRGQAAQAATVARLPVDYVGGGNPKRAARDLDVWLSEAQTRALLQDVPRVYNTQAQEALLTALAQTLSEWAGSERVLVALEGHGREEVVSGVDVSRTVGWFTSLYPVALAVTRGAGAGAALREVKEQLRAVPGRGVSYGLLRYLGDEVEARAELQGQRWPEVLFNYHGQFDRVEREAAGWRFAEEEIGAVEARDGERAHLLEVSGAVIGGRLYMRWTYGAEAHERATVERVAQRYIGRLVGLIESCQQPEAGGFSPADFPEAELTQEELDALIAEINPTISVLS